MAFVTRALLGASARSLPLGGRESKIEWQQSTPSAARYSGRQYRLRGRDRTNGFRGLHRNRVGQIVFFAESREYARPWWNQTLERFIAGTVWRTLRRRTTSSKIRCATSLLLI